MTTQPSITVTHVDNTEVTATIIPMHRVAFERQFKVPFSSLKDEPYEERLLWLGWYATTKGRPNPPAFDAWMETVAAYNIGNNSDEEEGEIDPLVVTEPSGPSLPSPSSPAQGSHTSS